MAFLANLILVVVVIVVVGLIAGNESAKADSRNEHKEK